MAPTDDLKAHAASSQDFYALLEISPAAADNEIRRAYRRAALKYHPDKVANPTQADIDKFHLLQIAYDVLSDEAVRQLYDNAREARERKRREVEMMDAAKRKMKEDLEARERAGDAGAAAAQRGLKRTWMMSSAADNEAEERLEREIQRIAENSQRRRREAEEKLMRETEEEERQERQERLAAEQEREERDRSSARVDRSKEGGTNVPELERAVKVHWIREGPGEAFDKDRLKELFATFGKVENTFLLKDKRQRVGEKKEKKTVATGVVVFTSIVSAHSAILDSAKKIKSGAEGDWAILDSVVWASGTGPDLKSRPDSRSPATTPIASPRSTSSSTSTPSIPASAGGSTKNKPALDFASLKNGPATPSMKTGGKPSFASFSARPTHTTPSDSSTTKNPTLTTPSLEEVTLMRLKTAQREKERKALEEQLRREDEAADAAGLDV
ncbi:cell cycle control protein (Cwf23), putative [Talaromyces stipitatus ATCC 10500]|uniref:Cell cycle control protein (Cwf23), putative n=1 Tax=Talaromyces stipitatus (strain ATCC 10500 / CBS 375.48 / QM 6759 / NRRL 1006) TaxID=441959 RepID=B8M327_TALSN|nr:cell cycle control protein (Cwf23), putative [Talaromyces stipitatus ATCC 10500]EED22003.1 cell cycle control protein (Cwf23), putative [Talaromyces stipitatus ATCC 10500]